MSVEDWDTWKEGGYKRGEKRREREECRKFEKEKRREKEEEERKKSENISCECKFIITKRENSDFGLGKQARGPILVSFLNFVEEFVVPHLGFDNSKFGRTGEMSQSY